MSWGISVKDWPSADHKVPATSPPAGLPIRAEPTPDLAAWKRVPGRRRERSWVRIRRWAFLATTATLIVTGAVTTAAQVATWVLPATSPPAPSVSDRELASA